MSYNRAQPASGPIRPVMSAAAEAILRQRHGLSGVEYHRKPSASKPADPAVIEAMAQRCDYIVVAIGS